MYKLVISKISVIASISNTQEIRTDTAAKHAKSQTLSI